MIIYSDEEDGLFKMFCGVEFKKIDGFTLFKMVLCVVFLVGNKDSWGTGSSCVRSVLEEKSSLLDSFRKLADCFK